MPKIQTNYKTLSEAIIKFPIGLTPAPYSESKLIFINSDAEKLNKSLSIQIQEIQEQKGKKYYISGDTGTSVRIFDISADRWPREFIHRGLQFARAALLGHKYSNKYSNKVELPTDFQEKLKIYLERIKDIEKQFQMLEPSQNTEKLAAYKAAATLTHQYLGELCHLINPDNPKQAHADILKAADLIMMLEPTEDIICSTQKSSPLLQFSEHINPEPISEKFDSNAKWVKFNSAKHGSWFHDFVGENWDNLKNKSAPSTARDLPHAANAWDEITVHITNEKYQESHSGRIGITTPYQFKGDKNKAERIKHAAEASQSVLETQYDAMTTRFINRWGKLYEGPDSQESITLPILHATYVAPTFFYAADRGFIDEKTKANQSVRENMPNNIERTLTNNNNKKLKFQFELLEVNNCINIHRHVAYQAPREREDSNKLIDFTANLLLKVKLAHTDQKPTENKNFENFENLRITSAYLSSASTFPPRFKGPNAAEQSAINAVTKALNDGKLLNSGTLSADAQRDLAIMLQAAVELKKLNHESIFSPIRRQINELPYVGPVLRPITFAAFLPARLIGYAASIPTRIFDAITTQSLTPFSSTLMGGRNKQSFKSAYEEILADQLGYSISGCKSALDRKGEVEVLKTAILKYQADTGKMPDYYDTSKNYDKFFTEYVLPIEKQGHQNRVAGAADFASQRKMWEIRTGQYMNSSAEELEMAKIGSAFRAPKASTWQKLREHTNNPFKNPITIAPKENLKKPPGLEPPKPQPPQSQPSVLFSNNKASKSVEAAPPRPPRPPRQKPPSSSI